MLPMFLAAVGQTIFATALPLITGSLFQPPLTPVESSSTAAGRVAMHTLEPPTIKQAHCALPPTNPAPGIYYAFCMANAPGESGETSAGSRPGVPVRNLTWTAR
jgi:hypothetical protein